MDLLQSLPQRKSTRKTTLVTGSVVELVLESSLGLCVHQSIGLESNDLVSLTLYYK